MKRWTILLLLLTFSFLTACGANTNNASEGADEQLAAPEVDEKQDQKILVNLQMKMIEVVRANLQPITQYEATGEGQEEAVAAGNKIAEELRAMEVPAELREEFREDMEQSKDLLAQYFEARVAGDNADEILANFHETIATPFVEVGLIEPNIEKEIQ